METFLACSALQNPCQCGHLVALHDEHGCAAFLAAFPETAGIRAHCRCQRPRSATIASHGRAVPAPASVSLRESNAAS